MARKTSALRLFFTALWRTAALLYGLVLLVVVLVVPLIVYMALFGGSHVTVPDKGALVWAPVGDLVEQNSANVAGILGSLVSRPERQSVVRDLVASLDRAADDDRIKLAFLKLDEMGAAQPGQIQDLVAAIDRFKKSGKPVIAWSPGYDQDQYALASQADTIYLDPLGYVFIPGYSAVRHYYKDALDELGVTINVFRVGKYKSFVEPFTRNDMSSAARQDNRAWMNTLWTIYRKQVTANRDLDPADIGAYIGHFAARLKQIGGDAARMAASAGLVDKVAPLHAVRAAIAKRVGADAAGDRFNQIDQADYLAATDAQKPDPGDNKRVALVVVEGAIVNGKGAPESAGGETIARLIADARRRDDVAALLLRVNSPGGSVTASERIRRQVALTRAAGKPVVVSMAGVAASGGYWLSMNANQIWAEPATITGSIGIFAVVPTFAKPLDKLGIHTDGVGTTELSGALRLDQPLAEPVKTMLQAGIEHGYDTFVSRVAHARGMDIAKVRRIAQGRVWAGADAQRVGLVDKLGGFTAAEHAAAKLAGLGPHGYTLEAMAPPATWRTALEQFIGAHAGAALMPAWLAALADDDTLAWLQTGLDDPRHLYARCFCRIAGGRAGFAGITNTVR